MEKPAPVDFPVHPLVQSRWSPRSFSDRAVSNETLDALFEAARWAPSCYNEQPWSFVVAHRKDPQRFSDMLGCLVERNQRWAKHASVLIIAVAKIDFTHNGAPNHHAFYDTGQAVAWLTAEATARGIRVHQMAGFSPDQARKLYAIPQSHKPLTAIALGYPGDGSTLPDDLRQAETAKRSRIPQAEFVFVEMWKQGVEHQHPEKNSR